MANIASFREFWMVARTCYEASVARNPPEWTEESCHLWFRCKSLYSSGCRGSSQCLACLRVSCFSCNSVCCLREFVICSEDQWDIYKLDPAYDCYIPNFPGDPVITRKLPGSQSQSAPSSQSSSTLR